jgi:hypothetical protein
MPATSATSDLKRAIPNIVILAVLVVILLVILTKFKWVSCSQVPGWCPIYCQMFGKSRVAIVYGEDGIGDPATLEKLIMRLRPGTVVERMPVDAISSGLLKNYELIVLEKAKTMTFRQAGALQLYLDSGGNLLWIGDSASNWTLSSEDIADALAKNASRPGYYEALMKQVNETSGFGPLSNYIMARYDRTQSAEAAQFKAIDYSHPIVRGYGAAGYAFETPAMPYAVVSEKPGVTKIASLKAGGKEYPAILETRYVGKIIYFAFPLDQMLVEAARASGDAGTLPGSQLLINLFDYLVEC